MLIDDPARVVHFLAHALAEMCKSPILIGLNLALGVALARGFYGSSRMLRRRSGALWLLGLFALLAAAYFSYFWQYPPGNYYREDDIPGAQFAHMVLLKMFPLLPLLSVLAYVAGSRSPSKDWKVPRDEPR
jgi:hypothetical protein